MLSSGPLLDDKGLLKEAGYSLTAVKFFDPVMADASLLRIKAWERFTLISAKGFAAEISVIDFGIRGAFSLTLTDFNKGSVNISRSCAFSLHRMNISDFTDFGKIRLSVKTDTASVISDGRNVKLLMFAICDGKKAVCELDLTPMNDGCLFISAPYEDKPKAFYSSMYKLDYSVKGSINLFGEDYSFTPADTVIRDSMRGVLPFHSGLVRTVSAGLISAYSNADTSCGGEFALYDKGVYTKLYTEPAYTFEPACKKVVLTPFCGFRAERIYGTVNGLPGYTEAVGITI